MEKNKEIPKAVIEAAKGLGTEIVYKYRRNGYDVFSVRMPLKEGEIMPPTGFPRLVVYKNNSATIVDGPESLDWL